LKEALMTDLWRLTATEAVRKLRKRELSPLELVEAGASRIETVEPKINALPIRFFDEAREGANASGAKPHRQALRHKKGPGAGSPGPSYPRSNVLPSPKNRASTTEIAQFICGLFA
jgi:hypothetical protein